MRPCPSYSIQSRNGPLRVDLSTLVENIWSPGQRQAANGQEDSCDYVDNPEDEDWVLVGDNMPAVLESL